jgi:hypothetical protein
MSQVKAMVYYATPSTIELGHNSVVCRKTIDFASKLIEFGDIGMHALY